MASAATITITPSSATVAPNGTFTVTLGYTTDSATTNFNLVMNYDTTLVDATATSTAGSPFPNTCAQNDALGRVAVVTTSGTGTALPGGNFCTVSFTAGGTNGAVNFTLSNTNFTGSPGGDVLGTATVTIGAAPVNRTLTFNPNFGSTITFTGGTGTNGTITDPQNIVVTSTGNTGTPSVSGCAISGAAAAQFSVAPTELTGFDTTSPQNLAVNCTRAAAAATATLTCNENDFDTAGTARTWTLSCPAGGAPTVNPTITVTPVSGSTITVPGGTVGSPSTTTGIDFSANGGSGAGTATIACTSTGNVRIGNAGSGVPTGTTANQTVTGSAAPLDIVVGVTLTNAAQTPAGTITCNFTGAVAGTATYNVNAPAGVVAAVAEIIPANDLWSKLALFGLIATLGGLVISFRSRH